MKRQFNWMSGRPYGGDANNRSAHTGALPRRPQRARRERPPDSYAMPEASPLAGSAIPGGLNVRIGLLHEIRQFQHLSPQVLNFASQDQLLPTRHQQNGI